MHHEESLWSELFFGHAIIRPPHIFELFFASWMLQLIMVLALLLLLVESEEEREEREGGREGKGKEGMSYNPLISSPLTSNPQLTNWYNTRHDVSRKIPTRGQEYKHMYWRLLGREGTRVLSW